MSESQLMQMPGPRDFVIYRTDPQAFSVLQKPWGWAHISVQKPHGARGMVTGQIDTCIIEGGQPASYFKASYFGKLFLCKLDDLK